MNKEIFLFIFALAVSCILHILIIFAVYYPGNFVVMPLTAGMVFSWLYFSGVIKDFSSGQKEFHTKLFLSKIPSGLKYILMFSAVYALFNFIGSISVGNQGGWVDFELGQDELSGISGFWILFYMLGFTASFIKIKILNEDHTGQDASIN